MKYLKRTEVRTGELFRATFMSGAETTSHDAACFFMIMGDKDVNPADLASHINLGEMTDPGHDWKEIRRIASTFGVMKGVAA
jgi:hypothetical protein